MVWPSIHTKQGAREGRPLLSHLAMIWRKQNQQTKGIPEAGVR